MMTSDNRQSIQYLLTDRVIFNPTARTLSSVDGSRTLSISENESCLLKLLLDDTCSKKKVLMEVWEKRGIIVTESSYYKLVRQLRNSFGSVGLDSNTIKTLHRVGISFTGAWTTISHPTISIESSTAGHSHKTFPLYWPVYRTIAWCTAAVSVVTGIVFILAK